MTGCRHVGLPAAWRSAAAGLRQPLPRVHRPRRDGAWHRRRHPGWRPAPGMLGAAHKPGAMPLRPLTLGDIYDARVPDHPVQPEGHRRVGGVGRRLAMAIPVLITALLTWTIGAAFDETGRTPRRGPRRPARRLQRAGPRRAPAGFGLLFVTGMIAHVTAAAAIGRRLSLGEAWAATRGKRWRLLGLSMLLWTMSIALIAVYVVGVILVFTRHRHAARRSVHRRLISFRCSWRPGLVLDPRLLPAGARR